MCPKANPNRKMSTLKEQLRVGWYGGWYGDEDSREYQNPADCNSLINHCLKAAQSALDDDKLLIGKLGNGLKLSEIGEETDPNLLEKALNLEVSPGNIEDEDCNDTFFVEDDCGEEINADDDDESD